MVAVNPLAKSRMAKKAIEKIVFFLCIFFSPMHIKIGDCCIGIISLYILGNKRAASRKKFNILRKIATIMKLDV